MLSPQPASAPSASIHPSAFDNVAASDIELRLITPFANYNQQRRARLSTVNTDTNDNVGTIGTLELVARSNCKYLAGRLSIIAERSRESVKATIIHGRSKVAAGWTDSRSSRYGIATSVDGRHRSILPFQGALEENPNRPDRFSPARSTRSG